MKTSNEKLYSFTSPIPTVIRYRRLLFFGHLMRMDDNRLTKKIFLKIHQMKSTNPWLEGIRRDLAETGLTETDTHDRNNFRKTIAEFQNFRVVKNTLHASKRKLTVEHLAKISESRRATWEKKRYMKKNLLRSPK